MTEFHDAMRDKLISMRNELQAIAASGEASAAVVELDQSKVGRLSRMDAMQSQAMAKASQHRRDVAQRKIAAALKRLDNGEFGDCQSCDAPIDPRRLEFDPTSTQCIECASAEER